MLGCATEPGVRRTESWSADLGATDQVLLITLDFDANAVSGSGTLTHLTNIDVQALTLSGTLRGDSLYLTYERPGKSQFQFGGRYAPQGLIGYLDGAEFDSVAVLFRPL